MQRLSLVLKLPRLLLQRPEGERLVLELHSLPPLLQLPRLHLSFLPELHSLPHPKPQLVTLERRLPIHWCSVRT